MKDDVKLLDVVALTENLPERELSERGGDPASAGRRGQVGTVVEVLARDVYDVEFADNDGRTYAELAVDSEKLLVLHYQPAIT